jgi:hypothetical protein
MHTQPFQRTELAHFDGRFAQSEQGRDLLDRALLDESQNEDFSIGLAEQRERPSHAPLEFCLNRVSLGAMFPTEEPLGQ